MAKNVLDTLGNFKRLKSNSIGMEIPCLMMSECILYKIDLLVKIPLSMKEDMIPFDFFLCGLLFTVQFQIPGSFLKKLLGRVLLFNDMFLTR